MGNVPKRQNNQNNMIQTPAECAYELVLRYWDIVGFGSNLISGESEYHFNKAKASAKLCVNRIVNELPEDLLDEQRRIKYFEDVLIEIDKL